MLCLVILFYGGPPQAVGSAGCDFHINETSDGAVFRGKIYDLISLVSAVESPRIFLAPSEAQGAYRTADHEGIPPELDFLLKGLEFDQPPPLDLEGNGVILF